MTESTKISLPGLQDICKHIVTLAPDYVVFHFPSDKIKIDPASLKQNFCPDKSTVKMYKNTIGTIMCICTLYFIDNGIREFIQANSKEFMCFRFPDPRF